MKRPVDADRADAELHCRPSEVAPLHERQKDLELAKGDLFVDAGKHNLGHRVNNDDPDWMLALPRAMGVANKRLGVTNGLHPLKRRWCHMLRVSFRASNPIERVSEMGRGRVETQCGDPDEAVRLQPISNRLRPQGANSRTRLIAVRQRQRARSLVKLRGPLLAAAIEVKDLVAARAHGDDRPSRRSRRSGEAARLPEAMASTARYMCTPQRSRKSGYRSLPHSRTSPSVSGSNMERDGQISSCRWGLCAHIDAGARVARPLRRVPMSSKRQGSASAPGVPSVGWGRRWLDE